MATLRSGDSDFISDCRSALVRERTFLANGLLWIIVAFFACATVWMMYAEVNQSTHCQGRVIPSASQQVVQSLEGGIVEELYIKEGDVVEEGQPLMKLDQTQFEATYATNLAQCEIFRARLSRLDAEANQRQEITFSASTIRDRGDLAESERNLFEQRTSQLEDQLGIHRESLKLARKELAMTEPLAREGIVSDVDVLRLQREINQLEGVISDLQTSFKTEALEQYDTTRSALEESEKTLQTYEDRVSRSLIVSPVRGVVNKVHINTIGGVIQSGSAIVEIVPYDEALLIEAYVNPTDIGFIHPNQLARLSFTAYDYSIYGMMDGTVENISPDTHETPIGERLFKVKVRTAKSSLDRSGVLYPIIPGMTVDVNIVSGRRTVLQYLLKPFTKARASALQEP